MVAEGTKRKQRRVVAELLADVRFINETMNRGNWVWAPLAQATRRATYEAIRYEDEPRGKPDEALLRRAMVTFEAMPPEARQRVLRGESGDPFVPFNVGYMIKQAMLRSPLFGCAGDDDDDRDGGDGPGPGGGGVAFGVAPLAGGVSRETTCFVLDGKRGDVQLFRQGNDWAFASDDDESVAMCYFKYGLSLPKMADALLRLMFVVMDRWQQFSAPSVELDAQGCLVMQPASAADAGGGVLIDRAGGAVAVAGADVRIVDEAKDRRGTGKVAHQPRRKSTGVNGHASAAADVEFRKECNGKNRPPLSPFAPKPVKQEGEATRSEAGELIAVA